MKEQDSQKGGRELRLMGRAAPIRSAVIQPLSAARWLLILIVAAGVYFFHGFLVPVLAALIIAFASWPLYRRLLAAVNGNRTAAATCALLMILAFLIIPIVLACMYAFNEIHEWVVWAVEANRHGAPVPEWIAALPVIGEWLAQ